MATETEQLVVSLEARIRDFEKNFEKANRTASRNFSEITAGSSRAASRMEADMSRASSGVVASFMRMNSGITRAFAFAGVGLGVRQLATSIRGVVSEAAHLVDTAETIGVTTKALQELRFAGGQAGVEVGQLDDALAKFSKQIGDASRGSGDLYEIFKANGIAIRDQAGNVRPLIELFRDYADLVSRAASAQEKNTLTTIAFGKSADDMGRLFDGGAAGIDKATAAANRLGAVIDDGKLQRIADIDDRWESFATTLSTTVKSAILGVVDDLDTILDRMKAVEDQTDKNVKQNLQAVYAERADAQASLAEIQKEITDAPNAMARQMASDALPAAQARLEELTQQALKLRDILDRRQGYIPPGTAPTPVIPPAKPAIIPPSTPPGTGNGGIDPKKAIDSVIQALRFEGEQLGRTAAKQELYNRLKAAGVTLDSEAGQAIAALVEKNTAAAAAIDKLTTAQKQFNDTGTYLGEGVVNALDQIALQGDDAADVVANLAKQLASAALQAGLLGSGPLAGLFGGGAAPASGAPGGIIGSLAGLLFGGFREGGGDVSPGKAYVVGEKRKEVFVPRTAGTILPDARRLGSEGSSSRTASINLNVSVNGGGSDPKANADLAKRLGKELTPAVRAMVLGELRTQMRPNGILDR